MKKYCISMAMILLFLSGCVSFESVFNDAKNMIHNNEAECVVIRDGEIVASVKGRGISPILELHDRSDDILRGAAVADKVIGRAAAFVAIHGGVTVLYGKIMSEDALELLEKNNIKCSYTLLVPKILNRQRNGLCPMEKTVEGINDETLAVKALREKIMLMKQEK